VSNPAIRTGSNRLYSREEVAGFNEKDGPSVLL
jgi:hypothetical protein